LLWIRDTLDAGRRTGRSLPGFVYRGCRGRKVRTPQGSVPDNVRDVSVKARIRPVPQKRYRLGYPSSEGFPERLEGFAWRAGPRRGKGEKVR
jgi:hypothetical protein